MPNHKALAALTKTMFLFAKRDLLYWHAAALAASAKGDLRRMAYAAERENEVFLVILRYL